MLPARGQSGKKSIIWAVRTTWETVGDGEFFCAECGGDRNYRRLTGRRRLTVLGVPLMSRGSQGPVVECAACQSHFGLDALDHPTTTRFSSMLRDAVQTVALAVLAAGGSSSRTATAVAASALRAAGLDDCSEEQLGILVEALSADADADPCGVALSIELHEVLGPLAPHLAPAGRESILMQGARIALADGPYRPAEREVLAAVGGALALCEDDTARLLAAAARTPS
ncbi:TerB family tellurite resistance protein [Streptomyces sp. NPDC050738]|uniref:TerB family tellurite resistance protein n=1 Tax=Streptomyces sp. NPDC050738 TaxID=3154744 RepID=UPI0034195736